MKTQYTQGPWDFEKWFIGEKKECQFTLIGNNTKIASLVIGDDGNPYTIGEHEAVANARLIAAAPALLEVLERLVACPDVNADMLSPETIKAAELARELISKVKGDL